MNAAQIVLRAVIKKLVTTGKDSPLRWSSLTSLIGDSKVPTPAQHPGQGDANNKGAYAFQASLAGWVRQLRAAGAICQASDVTAAELTLSDALYIAPDLDALLNACVKGEIQWEIIGLSLMLDRVGVCKLAVQLLRGAEQARRDKVDKALSAMDRIADQAGVTTSSRLIGSWMLLHKGYTKEHTR
jgi:hypothetical protein